MQKLLKRLFIFLIFFLLLPLTGVSFISNEPKGKQSPNTESISLNDWQFNPSMFDKSNINEWKETILKADQNNNGISDQFEETLNSLSKEGDFKGVESNTKKVLSREDITDGSFGKEIQDLERISYDNIPIIVNFPKGDINSIVSLFENLEGIVKSTYEVAINGFAGSIDYDGLNQFCGALLDKDIPFLVEEDAIAKANLYYASRNMNLRPYVWNTLSYTGDGWSSIAVIDTGIDDTHNFFTPGYSSGDFTKKIVGWTDEVNGLPTPYDDAGHGSHCAGIATGEGSPTLDGSGRTVSTFSTGYDATGYIINDGIYEYTAAMFNVTESGNIEIFCEFDDYTPGLDNIYYWAYLYHNETLLDSFGASNNSWSYTLSHTATSGDLGDYSLRITETFEDNDGNGYVDDPFWGFRGEIHWPFNPNLFGSGDAWQGVAPDTHLVGVKVLNDLGMGTTQDILDGLDWIIINKNTYNITTISMSLGYASGGQTSVIDAVNNAVDNGIVTVVAAGNSGPGGNNIGSPGDADNVITVAAMSYGDQVTEYSSSGGSSYTGLTTKPDIMAPGGSYYNFTMFSTDTNDGDATVVYSDGFPNDLAPMLGTSMATPAVAGASNLLIDAMGGHENWNYTAIEAKRVKALLLMTATETYPLTREVYTTYSPSLDRGGKDIHEGYGRLNIDAALEAYTQELSKDSTKSAWISSSLINPFNKHALGCYVDLTGGEKYIFPLSVPDGMDFDLHLYNFTPTETGEPIMLASSTSSVLGMDEALTYTPIQSGRYFLVAKAISGEGYANISYILNEFAPSLTDGTVMPTNGNQSTLFTYTVNYSDAENLPPIYINVSINDIYYLMSQQDPSDNGYSDGCIFQYSTYLQPGIYNYSFGCWDGGFYNSTLVQYNPTVSLTNLAGPTLYNGQVHPQTGFNITIFTFSVNYLDADNNAPDYMNVTINSTSYSMVKQDLFDSNYMDGFIYVYSTVLDEVGTYTYHFNCSDGVFTANLGPFIGPVVKEWQLFDGMYINHTLNLLGSGGPSSFFYSHYSGTIFNVTWDNIFGTNLWDVDMQTRIMTNAVGGFAFGNYIHTPVWIFTNVSVNDIVLIAVNGEGDHLFNVSDELIYYLPGFGWLEIWVLEDLTTPGGIVWYEKSTGILLNGTFYYMGGSANYKFDFVDTNVAFTYLPNDYEPSLAMGSVIPTTGNQSTLFTYTVNYTDIDNLPPLFVNVSINGTYYLMSKQDPFDNNYADGCIYEYKTYLIWNSYPYNYSFGCWDGDFYNYTSIQYNPIVSLTNEVYPTLSNGHVYPGVGFNGTTLFSYTVIYTDADNNVPEYVNVTIDSMNYTMVKQNPYDNNYMDGCEYVFKKILDELGLHTYYFTCSDSNFKASAGPYDGPFVVERKLMNYTMILDTSYSWINISGAKNLGLSDDDYIQQTMHFNFPFYNESYSQIYICSNGYITFYDNGQLDWYPSSFPDILYKRAIAVFAEDLLPAFGPVYVKNLTNPNRYVIIYDNIAFWPGSTIAGSFEIILYENGLIKFQYIEINDAGFAFCGLNRGEGDNYFNYYDNLNSSIVEYAIDFWYNIPPLNPSILINNGDITTSSTLVSLTLSAGGAEEMCFRNGTTGTWTEWEPYTTTKQLFLAGSTNNIAYTIYAKFRHEVGWTDPVSDSIIFLTIPQNPSIVINNDDATTDNTLITLTLSTAGATEMCFRNETTGSWTTWETYSITKQLYLAGSTDNTLYTISVKFRNSIGETSPVNDGILFLITSIAPKNPSIVINNDDASTDNPLVTLTLSADEATEMCFRNGTTGTWTSWESYGTTKQLYLAGSTNNTEYTIYVKFRNAIGETIPVSDDILFLITEDGDGDGDGNGDGVPEIPGYPLELVLISLIGSIGIILLFNKKRRLK